MSILLLAILKTVTVLIGLGLSIWCIFKGMAGNDKGIMKLGVKYLLLMFVALGVITLIELIIGYNV